jgi:endonuclease IV
MNIGAHVRGGGKLIPSLEAGVAIGATSIQIFTQSPRMWKPSQYAPEVLAGYREAQASHQTVTHTFCHATYLINLASPDRELYEKSVACLISNLSVARGMASSGLVLHVGSHMGAGFETVIKQIAEAFDRALTTAELAPPAWWTVPFSLRTRPERAGLSGEASKRSKRSSKRVGKTLDSDSALILSTFGRAAWTTPLWRAPRTF